MDVWVSSTGLHACTASTLTHSPRPEGFLFESHSLAGEMARQFRPFTGLTEDCFGSQHPCLVAYSGSDAL